MWLAVFGEALVEGNELAVPAIGCWQGRGVDGGAGAGSTTGDMALALVLTTVAIERRQPDQRCGLLAAELAEFGHADQERQGGRYADARDRDQQIESPGQRCALADGRFKAGTLAVLAPLESGDIGLDQADDPRIAAVFQPGLEPGNVFTDLLDEDQVVRQRL